MSQMNPPGAQPGAGNSHRPGQMTAVMRAMQVQSGPRVLRIGLGSGGRLLEERIIKQRTTVTVGPNEKSTFVVAFQALGAQFKLFELIGQDYHLNFTEQMTGRVALASGVTDLAALRGQAKRVGNVFQIKLTDEARGKVVVGETTFFFQFVVPPPVQPRPQLPLAVQGGFGNQIDWTLTVLAAFSFLIHFGLVGVMYSDWGDRAVGDDNMTSMLELAKRMEIPPLEEKPVVDDQKKDDKQKPDKVADNKTAPTKAPPGGGAPGAGAAKGPNTGSVSESKAAALSQAADQMAMSLLGGLAGNSAVQGATNRGDIPPVDLSGAAASGQGVANGSGELKTGGGGGPIQGGGGGKGLGGLGGGTGGSGTGGTAGTAVAVAGPKGDASVGGTSASVPVNNASAVIAGLRGRFRACYQRGLDGNPDMSGGVTMSVKVGPNGEVEGVSPGGQSGNLSPAVVGCIAGALRNAQFDAPGGSGSTLTVPVTFKKQ
jgi:hypothetical protein